MIKAAVEKSSYSVGYMFRALKDEAVIIPHHRIRFRATTFHGGIMKCTMV